MNVNKVLTKDYENIAINIEDPAFRGRNSNPIKPNFKGKKMPASRASQDQ